jgi:capsule polysaccharide export protein KpsE/RkpR
MSEAMQARDAVLAFQSRHQLLDPSAQAQATGALTAELEASRTRLQAELGGLMAYLTEDAFQVQALRARHSLPEVTQGNASCMSKTQTHWPRAQSLRPK